MFQVVALGLERIVGLVLDLPAGTPAHCSIRDIGTHDYTAFLQVRDLRENKIPAVRDSDRLTHSTNWVIICWQIPKVSDRLQTYGFVPTQWVESHGPCHIPDSSPEPLGLAGHFEIGWPMRSARPYPGGHAPSTQGSI